MFIAQPTLSQQIRRLEEMVGTPLLHRRRAGVRLTDAGAVLVEESRTVLSMIDHGMSQTRQAAAWAAAAAVVMPPYLPGPSPSKLRRGCGARPQPPMLTWHGWRHPSTPSLAGPSAPSRCRPGLADGGT